MIYVGVKSKMEFELLLLTDDYDALISVKHIHDNRIEKAIFPILKR